MNNKRRKSISELRDKLEDIKGEIEMLRDEEQDYLDNMPESMQSCEKYVAGENAGTNMDDAIGSLEDAISSLDESTV